MSRRYREINIGEIAMPICICKTERNSLIDVDGNAYLDFSSGYGVTNSGWHRKELIEDIKAGLEKLCYSPPWFPTQESIQLSEILLSLAPHNLTKCARATGGAEANETIFKAVYALSEKKGILSLTRSYHGGSKFSVNLSDADTFRLPKLPAFLEYHKVSAPYCYRCPLNKKPSTCKTECAYLVEDAIKNNSDIGVFFVEPVIGSGGAIVFKDDYLQMVQQICRHYKVIFALDEVITGFGRIGEITASKYYHLEPDAISLGKGMSSGLIPIGAAVLSEELANALQNYEDVAATFAWTPIACLAARLNIEMILHERLADRASQKGKYLLQQLCFLFNKYLPDNTGDIRGLGLLIGIELVESKKTKKPSLHLMKRIGFGLVKNGLMVCTSWDFQTIILMPPLNISDQELEKGLNIIETQLKHFSIQ